MMPDEPATTTLSKPVINIWTRLLWSLVLPAITAGTLGALTLIMWLLSFIRDPILVPIVMVVICFLWFSWVMAPLFYNAHMAGKKKT